MRDAPPTLPRLTAHELRTVRRLSGRTQGEMAATLGISIQAYRYYENGRSRVPPEYSMVFALVISQCENQIATYQSAKKKILAAGRTLLAGEIEPETTGPAGEPEHGESESESEPERETEAETTSGGSRRGLET